MGFGVQGLGFGSSGVWGWGLGHGMKMVLVKVVSVESGFGIKVVWMNFFGMKSDSFIPIWMKVYLTLPWFRWQVPDGPTVRTVQLVQRWFNVVMLHAAPSSAQRPADTLSIVTNVWAESGRNVQNV